jgi:3-phenylpropionate/trans-cinnamate dioxygenase ferredoxin reductase component
VKKRIVILGAGHAGVQAAASLRDAGQDGSIMLVDAQKVLPYQRPPLSKAFLKGDTTPDRIILRSEQFYKEQRIDLQLDSFAEHVDPVQRRIKLRSGSILDFDTLILATGARPRSLKVEGYGLKGVLTLRDLTDAQALKALLPKAQDIVVIGAGFIGLEFAAVAAASGAKVTVVETQSRVMARAISPVMSAAFEARHRQLGITFRFGATVEKLIGSRGKIAGVELMDGTSLKAQLVLVGIGVLAKDRLAVEAGLVTENGILVDSHLCTSHPAIFAVGDNNTHPNPFFGDLLRLESVQNAVDQAKHLASRLVGGTTDYRALPWFWTDQSDYKLQIAGVSKEISEYVIRGDSGTGAFSVFCFRGDRLAVVESLNKPGEHMIARRLIDSSIGLTHAEAADTSFDLKALLAKVKT